MKKSENSTYSIKKRKVIFFLVTALVTFLILFAIFSSIGMALLIEVLLLGLSLAFLKK